MFTHAWKFVSTLQKIYNECFFILSFILTPCPHTHICEIFSDVRWQNEAELGRVS